MPEDSSHPLVKEVPGHLLQFEEKLFGMTLTHLLTDLGLAGMMVLLTGALPIVPRLIVGALALLAALALVHGQAGGYSLLYWLFLLGRSWVLPRHTVWRSATSTPTKGEPRSVQQTWLPFDRLEHGTLSITTPGKGKRPSSVTCWVVVQVESAQNVRFLAEAEQSTLYERFKSLLDGLGFPLKCLSLVEQVDPQTDPALVAQRQALHHLDATPRLRSLQQASLRHQQALLVHCTATRHFVVVAASTAEVARQHSDGRALLSRLFASARAPQVTPEQVVI